MGLLSSDVKKVSAMVETLPSAFKYVT